ncbi:MAG: hypothetical protein B2I17_04375 [Thermoplasmatales archaeon B_DKE]|nr:MAG: hypothetical protein B2I17_04375 [Thermoplasmatales archaeon B_DKE]
MIATSIIVVVLIIALVPFNEIIGPHFSVTEKEVQSTMTGVFANSSSTNNSIFGSDAQSTTLIIEPNKVTSSLQMNLSRIFAFLDVVGNTIQILFNLSISGTISSTLNPSSVTLEANTIAPNLSYAQPLKQWLSFSTFFSRYNNASIEGASALPNMAGVSNTYHLLNRPTWNIFTGYSEPTYHFSISGEVNLMIIPYIGEHIINISAQMNIYSHTVFSSVNLTLINEV